MKSRSSVAPGPRLGTAEGFLPKEKYDLNSAKLEQLMEFPLKFSEFLCSLVELNGLLNGIIFDFHSVGSSFQEPPCQGSIRV